VDLVAILRALWRGRIFVCIGLVVAIGVGLLAARGETRTVGIASTRMVVDTRPSNLVAPAPQGADSLTWRAALLANKLATGPFRERLATAVGIPLERLIVVQPPLKVPTVPTTLAPRALEAGENVTADYVLTVRFDEGLPIITTEAHAPSGAAAKRLVEASVDALLVAATPQRVWRMTQPYEVSRVATTRVREVVNGPGRVMPAAFALVTFIFWCAALVLLQGALRAWRGAGRVQPA
jgi:hypothetical protein